ncbi:NADH-quinone oxidoreductase subunit NuoE [Sinisalibacter lacisalsi]|uniref:NADH-quinone oxidoreductase subunit E n=1 Tax=Sinisalibacter lacisalsi TaxID=1526570 RepID=A0ABQ1QNN4_9RHOB|nr:NADH-quinone oxidoreductase subunit NuoE [Sinisalibacter lacisalsi]GGD34813.1 NADH-quinone oxidoreductase subunit E [Sinisalibacter lacisalsi]
MLRRLHHDQPESFAFTPANLDWAKAQLTKYPEGREASAVIPLLWRAQEQEGWLSKPAIEYVADMLGMAHIRALEVATFYFMFQLQPVGSVAHFQICGTLSCMIMGAEDLVAVAKEKIAPVPHMLSADGRFSWEEVECLGSCANAPMAQVGKDYYEDLSTESFAELIDRLAAGEVPVPGPQNGRYAAEPLSGLSSLTDYESGRTQYNASVALATGLGDTIKRIDGSEVPVTTPWLAGGRKVHVSARKAAKPAAKPAVKAPPRTAGPTGVPPAGTGTKPEALAEPRAGGADDLKQIKGVGPKLESLLNTLGFFHFDQIAKWTGAEVAWVDENLEGFKGRVSRDDWVEQAKRLAAGQETEFSAKVKKGDVY